MFGSDMESLQEAFYRVQAAMSTLSGVQQIATALNKDNVVSVVLGTKMEGLRQKALARSAAAEAAYNTQKAAGVGISKLWTAAQWKLNAALAANPLGVMVGIILGAVAAVALLVAGISKLVDVFSGAAKAQGKFEWAMKKLEEVQRENAIGEAERAFQRQEQIRKTNEEEEKALLDAEARNATEMEMAKIKLEYAKKREQQTKAYADAEIKRNQEEVDWLKRAVEEKKAEVDAYRDGSRKKKKAEEELTEATQKYYEALQKTKDLEAEVTSAGADVKKLENEIKSIGRSYANNAKEMRQQLAQLTIDLMKDGQEKEIAQIKLGYQQQIKEIKGNSKLAKDTRKALLEKEAKEIEEVRKQYALREQQLIVKQHQNELDLLAQLGGTEQEIARQIQLSKKIAEEEAKIKIDSLDKNKMSEEEYAAEVEAIRLELNAKLRQIDEQEISRLADFQRKKTELVVAEAELETQLLTGSEPVEKQKQVWQDFYAERKKQFEENAELEIQEIERSTDSEEVKAVKIKQIRAQLKADLLNNEREMNEALIGIDAQYLDNLQRNVEKAEREVEKAQGTGKLKAIEVNNSLFV
jgi:hypothetical protein